MIYREGRGTAPSFLHISTRWEVSDQFHTHEKNHRHPPAPIELKARCKHDSHSYILEKRKISLLLPGIETRVVRQKTSNKTGATDCKNYPDEAVSETLIKTVGGLMPILEILKNTKNNERVFGLFQTAWY